VIRYAIAAESAVEADVQAAFDWYEGEEPGLGFELSFGSVASDLLKACQSLFEICRCSSFREWAR
jgi:hypothetical protein